MIRLTISDANCLLLISVKCERERSIYNRQRKREKKKKYYRYSQSHHLFSNENIPSLRGYTQPINN